MKKIYKSSVSGSSWWLLALVMAILVGPIFLFEDISGTDLLSQELLPLYVISLVVCGFFLWIYLGTYYTIDGDNLYHRSGPFYGKMKISSIRKIKYHSGWIVPVTYRPATDTKGIIITYNKFDEVYFSPKELETFINELKSINPEIEFVNFKKS